ncbi:hypothetical protein QTP88_019249 [Uroleucon formosanum]
MDFIQAMKLVKATRQFLTDMRIDDNLSNIFSNSESFCKSLDLEKKNLPIKRASNKKKKKMSVEKANDERLLSTKDRYISEVYNMTLDKTLMKMDDRYTNAKNVFNEISLFSAEHLLRKSATPYSSFNYICKWLSSTNIDQDSSNNFNNFMKTYPEISENVNNNSTIEAFSHENNSSNNVSMMKM